MRYQAFIIATGLLVTSANMALAGGIPVIDAAKAAQNRIKIEHQLKDDKKQQSKTNTRAQQIDKQQKIITKNNEIYDATNKSKGTVKRVLGTKPFKQKSATGDDAPAHVKGAADRLFGDAARNIEMRIIQVAKEYQNSAGVRRVGLNPLEWRMFFQALIKQESRFNPRARSKADAYGLCQLMPGTANDLGVNRYDMMDNLRGGAKYITTQMKSFGRLDYALAAYNAGPGNVRKYGGIPPFPETRKYVPNILKYWAAYKTRYGKGLVSSDGRGLDVPLDIANGEVGSIGDAVDIYTKASLADTVMTNSRIAEIIKQIGNAQTIRESVDLNTLLKIEIARSFINQYRVNIANQKMNSTSELASGTERAADSKWMDFRYKQNR